MPSRKDQLRAEYLAEVVAALASYIDDGEPLHIESERGERDLRIVLTLDDPDAFHELLSRLMAERLDEVGQGG